MSMLTVVALIIVAAVQNLGIGNILALDPLSLSEEC